MRVWLAASLALLVVALVSGCGGFDPLASEDQETPVTEAGLVGTWEKTHTWVNDVEQKPIGWPMTICFNADGTYRAHNTTPYEELGTWQVTGAKLVLHMSSNSYGAPASDWEGDAHMQSYSMFVVGYQDSISETEHVSMRDYYTRQ
jgi:uncharacterized protein YceK